MKIANNTILISLIFLASFATRSFAEPIAVPALAQGAQYRLAFVTSGFRDATSTNIADYDAFVAAAAAAIPELATLRTSWKVIGSTDTIAARDHTGTNPTKSAGVPIYLIDGTKVVDDNADLWDGKLDKPICRTETGADVCNPHAIVWTGTNQDGGVTQGAGLGGKGKNGHGVAQGVANRSYHDWVKNQAQPDSIQGKRFYALSGILTIPGR
ncbi:MAG: hypothetical protein ACJAW1_003780 [Glaciecola sp.]|jgi:hypothetical protein